MQFSTRTQFLIVAGVVSVSMAGMIGCSSSKSSPSGVDPAISGQPVSVIAVAGASASFTVSATGDAPLTYQWRKDGSALAGATGATLSLTAVAHANAGVYDCVVSNGSGMSVSGGATLRVNTAPSIVAQPAAQAAPIDGSVTFTVAAATEDGTLGYQWRKNGTAITGATSAALTLAPVANADVASYTCVVTNTLGSTTTTTTTAAAGLVIVPGAPFFTSQPADLVAAEGASAHLTVAADAASAMTYQWLKNGVALPGATAATLTLPALTAADDATYACVLTSGAYAATSNAARLTVNLKPLFTTQPASASPVSGAGAAFTVAATSNGTLSYQWYKDAAPVTGATAPALTLATVAAADLGTYTCVVTSTLGGTTATRTSAPAVLALAQTLATPVATVPAFMTTGSANLAATTQDQGPGTTYHWTLAGGTITDGQGTRAITFTAGAVGTLSATVVASNATGTKDNAAAPETGAIVAFPTAMPLLPRFVHPGDSWMKASTPDQGGMSFAWSVTGDTSGGASVASAGNAQTGFTAGPNPGAFTVHLAVQNQASLAATGAGTVQVQTGTWIVKDGGANCTLGSTATMAPLGNGLLLAAGGFLEPSNAHPSAAAYLFDPGTAQWTPTASLHEARGLHAMVALPDGRILVAGGSATFPGLATAYATSTVELYDPATGAWTSGGTLLMGRIQPTATLLANGKVLFTGGAYDPENDTLNTAELYDPATGTSTAVGAMVVPRMRHTATQLTDGRVLVVGGDYGAMTSELFDPVARTWTAGPATTNTYEDHTATLLPDGRVLMLGGTAGEYYNPNPAPTGTFDNIYAVYGSDEQIYRKGHTATLLTQGPQAGQVMILGGTTSGSATQADPTILEGCAVEFFTPGTPGTGYGSEGTSTWTLGAAPLKVMRRYHAAVAQANGDVVVAGGATSINYMDQPTSVTEVYHASAATPAWVSQGQPVTRKYQTMTVLPNGKVLVAGGLGAATEAYTGGATRSAMIYDPVANTWTPTGSMHTARYSHTATLLPDGKVIVIGGQADMTLNDTEIWNPANGTWTPGASLSMGRADHCAVLLADGTSILVLAGSQYSSTWPPLSTYELLTQGGTVLATTPDAGFAANMLRQMQGGASAFLLSKDPASPLYNKVVMMGGKADYSTANDQVDVYDPAPLLAAVQAGDTSAFYNTDLGWTNNGALHLGRAAASVTPLGGGTFLVAGGRWSDGISYGLINTETAELYMVKSGAPGAGTSTDTGSMVGIAGSTSYGVTTPAGRRAGHHAALLPSGKVLVTGNNMGLTPSTEIWDPAGNHGAGSWTATGGLTVPRGDGSVMVSLPDGTAMILGGDGADAVTEVYHP